MLSLAITPFFDKLVLQIFAGGEMPSEESGLPGIILGIKVGFIIGIYIFSSYIKKFREDDKDFEDPENLGKIIDNMISKIQ